MWRKGKYVNIYRIPRDDPRYEMLRCRPMIRQVINESSSREYPLRGSVWFKLPNKKFMVITVRNGKSWYSQPSIYGLIWEMHYDGKTCSVYLGE